MEFYYVAYLLIQFRIDVPFEDVATFRYKEDAESYVKDRTEKLTKKGFYIIRSKVSKRKVRKNNKPRPSQEFGAKMGVW